MGLAEWFQLALTAFGALMLFVWWAARKEKKI